MQNTESFGRGNIWETITSIQSVPFTLNVSYVPENENQYITISPDTVNEEIFYYTTKTWTVWGAGTLNITARGYNKENSSTDSWNQKEHDINSVYKLALNHVIINGKADLTDLASNTNWEGASLIWIEDAAWDFTATDVEWALAELALWAPWVADASETVAGKVEISTDAELGAWTSTGWTWARLIVSNNNTSTTQVTNKVPVLDANGRVVPFINGQADGSSTTTEKGLVETATDSEMITGTDVDKHPTPAQVGWPWHMFFGYETYYEDSAQVSQWDGAPLAQMKSYTAQVDWTFHLRINAREWSGFGWTIFVYKNGSPVSWDLWLTFPASDSDYTLRDIVSTDTIEIWGQDTVVINNVEVQGNLQRKNITGTTVVT